MLIAASIIFNEEDYIRRYLEHILSVVDKVFIVDGGSTDRTLSIIEKMNSSKIILDHNKWDFYNPAMFRDQRNFGLTRIDNYFDNSFPDNLWMLLLDADELLNDALFSFVKDRIFYGGSAGLYAIGRRWIYSSSGGDIEASRLDIDWQPRLLFYSGQHRYTDPLHEIIRPLNNLARLDFPEYALLHKKTLARDLECGSYYSYIINELTAGQNPPLFRFRGVDIFGRGSNG